MKPANRMPSPLSIIVFVAGLAGAVTSGLWAFRTVGLYGGPITTGFHREWNSRTGQYQLVHETVAKSGMRVRRELADSLWLESMELRFPASMSVVAESAANPSRIGFSTLNDDVIDAWMIRDAQNQSVAVEVSTKRNGRIDRWERYEKGGLVRADLDTNGNGRADRWMTYENGILMATYIDADEDGRPDASRP